MRVTTRRVVGRARTERELRAGPDPIHIVVP
jgi:hypothetical protein